MGYLEKLTVKDLRDCCSKHNKSDEDCDKCPLAFGNSECMGIIHDYIDDDESAEAAAKRVYEDLYFSYYDKYKSMGGNISVSELTKRGVCPRTIYEDSLYDSLCVKTTDTFHAHCCVGCEVCWTERIHR